MISISLFRNQYEGYSEYLGEKIFDIDFDKSKSSIRSLLGQPLRTSRTDNLIILGKIPSWDLYWLEELDSYIHFQYAENEASIDIITLSKGDTENRLKDI